MFAAESTRLLAGTEPDDLPTTPGLVESAAIDFRTLATGAFDPGVGGVKTAAGGDPFGEAPPFVDSVPAGVVGAEAVVEEPVVGGAFEARTAVAKLPPLPTDGDAMAAETPTESPVGNASFLGFGCEKANEAIGAVGGAAPTPSRSVAGGCGVTTTRPCPSASETIDGPFMLAICTLVTMEAGGEGNLDINGDRTELSPPADRKDAGAATEEAPATGGIIGPGVGLHDLMPANTFPKRDGSSCSHAV